MQCQANALRGAAPVSAITLLAIDANTLRLVVWLSIPGSFMTNFASLIEAWLGPYDVKEEEACACAA